MIDVSDIKQIFPIAHLRPYFQARLQVCVTFSIFAITFVLHTYIGQSPGLRLPVLTQISGVFHTQVSILRTCSPIDFNQRTV